MCSSQLIVLLWTFLGLTLLFLRLVVIRLEPQQSDTKEGKQEKQKVPASEESRRHSTFVSVSPLTWELARHNANPPRLFFIERNVRFELHPAAKLVAPRIVCLLRQPTAGWLNDDLHLHVGGTEPPFVDRSRREASDADIRIAPNLNRRGPILRSCMIGYGGQCEPMQECFRRLQGEPSRGTRATKASCRICFET